MARTTLLPFGSAVKRGAIVKRHIQINHVAWVVKQLVQRRVRNSVCEMMPLHQTERLLHESGLANSHCTEARHYLTIGLINHLSTKQFKLLGHLLNANVGVTI